MFLIDSRPNISAPTSTNCLKINEEVNIGDWCLLTFKKRLIIGLVLSFANMTGTTQRTKEFSRSFASVKPPNTTHRENPIGILCTYFQYDSNGQLSEEHQSASYVSLSNYRATIVAPTMENDSLRISEELLDKIITEFQGN